MKDLLYLKNILFSINLIEDYLKNKNIEDFKKSILLRDAVCKRIEEIGESIKKISSAIKKKYPQIEWEVFLETRNFLTHVYQMVNVNKLWNVLQKEIPKLKKEINILLKKENKS
jgi:uncharacterized protein with HEPN domain